MNRIHRLPACVRVSLKPGAAVLGAALAMLCLGGPRAQGAKEGLTYENDILPVFKDSCVRCHSLDANNPKKKAAGGLQLDNLADALKGGKNGSADIVPGKSADSLLYKLLTGPVTVKGKDIDAMPKPKRGQAFKSLPQDKIDLVRDWIDQGAK